MAYNLNCWLMAFNREEDVKVATLQHATPATARLRVCFSPPRSGALPGGWASATGSESAISRSSASVRSLDRLGRVHGTRDEFAGLHQVGGPGAFVEPAVSRS